MVAPVSDGALSPALSRRISGIARVGRGLDALAAITPRRRQTGPIRRIGVLLQWGIGDAVIALPLLSALHDTWPDAQVEPIGKPFLGELLRGEPGVTDPHILVPPWTRFASKYRLWDSEWRRYLRELRGLRRQTFDLLVAPRCDPRDVLQARLIRASAIAGQGAAGGRAWLAYDAGVPLLAALAGPRHGLSQRLAEAIAGQTVDPVPRFRVRPDGAAAHDRLQEAGYRGGPVLAVAFGASHPLRYWDAAKVSAVLDRLRGAVGFIVIVRDPGGPGTHIALPPGLPGMDWSSGLAELKAMLSTVAAVFCADSGVMHIAAALGRPVAAVFGPSEPAMFGPPGDQHRKLVVPDMLCRPCFDACIYDRPICYDALTVDQVAAAVRDVLAA